MWQNQLVIPYSASLIQDNECKSFTKTKHGQWRGGAEWEITDVFAIRLERGDRSNVLPFPWHSPKLYKGRTALDIGIAISCHRTSGSAVLARLVVVADNTVFSSIAAFSTILKKAAQYWLKLTQRWLRFIAIAARDLPITCLQVGENYARPNWFMGNSATNQLRLSHNSLYIRDKTYRTFNIFYASLPHVRNQYQQVLIHLPAFWGRPTHMVFICGCSLEVANSPKL